MREQAWRAKGSPSLLSSVEASLGVQLQGALGAKECREWTRRVYRARRNWVDDFDGEQFALGRAFYTHYETQRSELYFRDAAASNARVELTLPGMQRWAMDLFASAMGGLLRERLGFCGAGVHVFPAGGKVARRGGVVHFDVEGLTPLAIKRRHRAMSLVVMLQPPLRGGGLRVYDVEYSGTEDVSDEELEAPRRLVRYAAGDAFVMSSYRLHQIRPFTGDVDRVSITLHAAEVDDGVWETWF